MMDLPTIGVSMNANITIHNKAEKIVSAVFLVANLIPENESIKDKIKELGINIISLSIRLTKNEEYKHVIFKDLDRSASEMLSFLNIAFLAGFISEMNASIIKSEFEFFLKHLKDISQIYSLKKTINSKEFFSDDLKKDTVNIYSNVDASENIHKTPVVAMSITKKDVLSRKDQRGKAILDVLHKKGEVNIKDISSSIKGCSEKTIQREINDMIQTGIIKRTGDRRWSRYSLI